MDYLQTKGRIFDIQRYSVHDGPGIRTIVFLKGCVLRCRWCCNPESQEYKIQTMKVLGEDKVIGRDVTVEEMIKVVEEDRPYYWRSGGGLTLSGGESLCQPEFARDLLRAAKEHGLNTALESMACAPFETIETILPYLDLYLMDIKHTNPVKHKEFTGRPNDLMMEPTSATDGGVMISAAICSATVTMSLKQDGISTESFLRSTVCTALTVPSVEKSLGTSVWKCAAQWMISFVCVINSYRICTR